MITSEKDRSQEKKDEKQPENKNVFTFYVVICVTKQLYRIEFDDFTWVCTCISTHTHKERQTDTHTDTSVCLFQRLARLNSNNCFGMFWSWDESLFAGFRVSRCILSTVDNSESL